MTCNICFMELWTCDRPVSTCLMGKTWTVTGTCTNRVTQICTYGLNKANSSVTAAAHFAFGTGFAGSACLFEMATFTTLTLLSRLSLRLQFLFLNCSILVCFICRPRGSQVREKTLRLTTRPWASHSQGGCAHVCGKLTLLYEFCFLGASLKTDIKNSNIETGTTSVIAAVHVTLWLLPATSWSDLHELEC